MPVIIACDHCGKECEKSNYAVQRASNNFCSRDCASAFRKKTYEYTCSNCKCKFITEKYRRNKMKFCSAECRNEGLFEYRSNRDKYSAFRIYTHVRTKESSNPQKIEGFDLDVEFLYDLYHNKQKGKCAITGLPMILFPTSEVSKRQKSPYNASLDRIDSSQPYCKSNVQFVCLAINYAKNTFDQEEMQDFIEDIRLNK